MARIRGDATVGVEDLDKLVSSLKAIDPALPRKLRAKGKEIADFVAADARIAAGNMGSTPAHVAPSIKGAAGAKFAAIVGGGPAFPMFQGAEFGAGHDKVRQRSTGTYLGYNQFQPWAGGGRGTNTGGYFMWPTIRRDMPRIEREYLKGATEVIQEAGIG